MRHAVAIGAGVLLSAIVFPWLPRHLDVDPDAIVIKTAVLFFLPITAGVIHVLLRSVLRSSRHSGEDSATKTILWCVTLFLMSFHALLIGALMDLGRLAAERLVLVALGIALAIVGNVLPRLSPNLALGIRTTRTLSDRQCWMATHRITGYAVVGVGVAMALAGGFLRGQAVIPVLTLIVLAGGVAVFRTYRRAFHV